MTIHTTQAIQTSKTRRLDWKISSTRTARCKGEKVEEWATMSVAKGIQQKTTQIHHFTLLSLIVEPRLCCSTSRMSRIFDAPPLLYYHSFANYRNRELPHIHSSDILLFHDSKQERREREKANDTPKATMPKDAYLYYRITRTRRQRE